MLLHMPDHIFGVVWQTNAFNGIMLYTMQQKNKSVCFPQHQMVSLHAWQMSVCTAKVLSTFASWGDASGARCSAADSLLDDWFLSEPRPAETKQMQMFVQQILTQQQAHQKHSIE